MPFEVKADMKVAPVSRRSLNSEEKLLLDKKCNKENTQITNLYLAEIKNKKIVPRKSSKTWPLEAKDDVVVLGKCFISFESLMLTNTSDYVLFTCRRRKRQYIKHR